MIRSSLHGLAQIKRSTVDVVLRGPMARLRGNNTTIERLLIVPQDLRTPDPSLAGEIARGHFGLAGATVALDGVSPFDVTPPSQTWSNLLHGFDWLRDLRAARSDSAQDLARELTLQWIDRHSSARGPAWNIGVLSRRIINWLSGANLLLDGAGQKTYHKVMDSLDKQRRHLWLHHQSAPLAADRLTAHIALMMCGLCAADQMPFVDEQLGAFADEIDRQILPDGGHVTRNPAVLVEIALDLLPLRQCFTARDRQAPEQIAGAIARILPMLRYMRLGNGSLARFNGVGPTMTDRLVAALSYEEMAGEPLLAAAKSRYLRMQRRQFVMLCDVGTPPAVDSSAEAHAGCLSFELSSGLCPIIVNCGAPGPADQDWRLASRATAMHSTLTINDTSSANLLQNKALERHLGAAGLEKPTKVSVSQNQHPNGNTDMRATHNGYLDSCGRLHTRSMQMSALGDSLKGIDRIEMPSKTAGLRPSTSFPFAVHFHFHPGVDVTGGSETNMLELKLSNGEHWRFSCKGARLSMEESNFLAEFSGPRRSLQAALRGTFAEEAEVRWRLERVSPAR